jgi:exopolysaccharide production protein ExoY
MGTSVNSPSIAGSAVGTSASCRTNHPVKRTLDVAGAVLGILFLSPLLLVVATLVKLTDGGSIFYGHKRVGRYGREFRCWKFRTMVQNGDEVLERHLADNPEARQEWLATRKLQDDPRVTRVGGVLRKLSLDELPQLLNIVTGEMSIVGPRPVVSDELRYYGSHAHCYLRARPGLTGLWQVSGRNDVSYDARVAFDRQYVENWTFVSDLSIIARTIPAVCLSRGSY